MHLAERLVIQIKMYANIEDEHIIALAGQNKMRPKSDGHQTSMLR